MTCAHCMPLSIARRCWCCCCWPLALFVGFFASFCSVLFCIVLFLLFSKLNVVFFSFGFFSLVLLLGLLLCLCHCFWRCCCFATDIYALQRKYAKCRDITKYESNIMFFKHFLLATVSFFSSSSFSGVC